MSAAKKLALIAAGYALCVVGGLAAVAVNELFMPADVAQGSPGMVAFGDMILFMLVAGFLGIVPTWFLLKLLVEKAPHALLTTELLVAAIKRELRRRSAIEPVIGHMKAEGHLGRCYLKGTAGDAANVILTAVGHNLRLVLAWLRIILCLILAALRSALAADPKLKLAS